MDVVGVLGIAAEETWLKRFELMWRVEFFGILHCVQDDSNSLQDNSNRMAKWLGVGIFQADLHPC
jgi:hypothetical protein